MTVLGGKRVVLRPEFAREVGEPAVGPEVKFLFETNNQDSNPLKGEFEVDGGG